MMNQIQSYIKEHWKAIIVSILAAIILGAMFLVYLVNIGMPMTRDQVEQLQQEQL